MGGPKLDFTADGLRNWLTSHKTTHPDYPDCWTIPRPAIAYPSVYIGPHVTMHAHKLSYLLFAGLIPDGKIVMHTCNNVRCVKPEHLVLGTQRENIKQAYDQSRRPKPNHYGDRNPNAKIKESDITDIAKLAATGMRHKTIAGLYGISKGHVTNLLLGNVRAKRQSP